MKINLWIFLITVFLMANTYYDGKFTEYLTKGKNIKDGNIWICRIKYVFIK